MSRTQLPMFVPLYERGENDAAGPHCYPAKSAVGAGPSVVGVGPTPLVALTRAAGRVREWEASARRAVEGALR